MKLLRLQCLASSAQDALDRDQVPSHAISSSSIGLPHVHANAYFYRWDHSIKYIPVGAAMGEPARVSSHSAALVQPTYV